MYLARKALESYKEYLSKSIFDDGHGLCIYPIDSGPYPESSIKVRLEAESPSEDFGNVEGYFIEKMPLPKNIVDNIFDSLEADLESILIFSDKNIGSAYPWENQIDGVIKRKKVPTEISLLTARTYREFKPMRDSIEFTTFVRLDIQW